MMKYLLFFLSLNLLAAPVKRPQSLLSSSSEVKAATEPQDDQENLWFALSGGGTCPVSNAFGAVFKRKPGKARAVEISIEEPRKCSRRSNSCEVVSDSVPPMLKGMMTAFNLSENGDSIGCEDCVTPEFKSIYGNDEGVMNAAVDEYEKKLTAKLRHELDKKILDDITKNFENVRFFVANSGDLFKNSTKNESQTDLGRKAEKLHCADGGYFKKAVNERCGNDPARHRKAKRVFESFGDKFSDDYPLNTIGALIISSGVRPLDNKARIREDNERYAFSKQAGGPFMKGDRFLTQILQNRELVTQIAKASRSAGLTPMESIYALLQKQLLDREENGSLVRLLTKEMLGVDLQNNKFDENRFSDLFKKVNDIMSWTRDLHSGIDATLSDVNLFADAANSLKESKEASVSLHLEKAPLMVKHFERKCGELVSNFAAYVCASDGDLLSKANKADLAKLVNAEDPKEKALGDVLLCQKGMFQGKATWSNFPIDRQLAKPSDFFECRKSDAKNYVYRSQVCRARHNKDQRLKDYAKVVAKTYGGKAVVLANDAYSTMVMSSALDLPGDVRAASSQGEMATTTAARSTEGKKDDPVTAPVEQQSPPSDYNQVYATGASTSLLNKLEQQKAVTADNQLPTGRVPASVADDQASASKGEADRQTLNPSSDPLVMQQLSQLKEELLSGQKRLEKVLEENRRLKEQYEEGARELEDKRAQLIDNLDHRPLENKNAVGNLLPRDNFPLNEGAAIARSTQNTSVSQSPSTGATEGASLGSLRNLTGSSAALSSREIAAAVDPIVISASGSRTSGLEVRSDEVSVDVMKFVQKTDDVNELLRIRSSGMKYRYQTADGSFIEMFIDYKNLTEDVKRLIDQKIADSGVGGDGLKRVNDEIKKLRRTAELVKLKIQLAESMK